MSINEWAWGVDLWIIQKARLIEVYAFVIAVAASIRIIRYECHLDFRIHKLPVEFCVFASGIVISSIRSKIQVPWAN